VIPATVPFIATGVRLALGRLLIGVVVAELYAQTQGIGVMIDRAADTLQSDRMMFGVLLFTLMGVITTELASRVEKRFQRWRPSVNVELEEAVA
jgi:NitT/TauT family transport system permease protein